MLSAYVVPYAAATIVAGQLCDARGPRVVLRVALLLAVIAAAGLVATSGTAWPDLVVAAAMASLFLHSSTGIIRQAREELREESAVTAYPGQ